MYLNEITMKEFKDSLKTTKMLIVPFGVVEAHGTHLPLGTDTIIMEEAVRRVERKKKVFVAPPVNFGLCTSTGEHPGTIGISADTLRRLTYDIVKEAYDRGLRDFILISGHGGSQHVNAMKESGEKLTKELKGVRIAALSVYEIMPKEAWQIAETKNDSHAGEIETSLILAIDEKLVKGRGKEEYPNIPKPIIVKDKQKYWPGAIWGNPKKATKDKGERVLEMMEKGIIKLMADMKKIKQ